MADIVTTEEDFLKDLALFIATKIGEMAKDNLIEFKAVDTGYLLSTMKVYSEGKETILEFTADYASAVEYGEKDPNVRWYDIHDWLKRKTGIINEKELGAKTTVITNKIRTEGQTPKLYVTKAIYSFLDEYKK